MKNGFYRVKFTSNQHQFGEGIVIIKDGMFNGADIGCIYKGQFKVNGFDCSANVLVKRHNPNIQTVFGNREGHKLAMTGRCAEETFTLTGFMAENPGNQIAISGSWFESIVE